MSRALIRIQEKQPFNLKCRTAAFIRGVTHFRNPFTEVAVEGLRSIYEVPAGKKAQYEETACASRNPSVVARLLEDVPHVSTICDPYRLDSSIVVRAREEQLANNLKVAATRETLPLFILRKTFGERNFVIRAIASFVLSPLIVLAHVYDQSRKRSIVKTAANMLAMNPIHSYSARNTLNHVASIPLPKKMHEVFFARLRRIATQIVLRLTAHSLLQPGAKSDHVSQSMQGDNSLQITYSGKSMLVTYDMPVPASANPTHIVVPYKPRRR